MIRQEAVATVPFREQHLAARGRTLDRLL